MADETEDKKTPKPRASRARGDVPPKKPAGETAAVAKPAARGTAKKVDNTTAKSVVAGKAGKPAPKAKAAAKAPRKAAVKTGDSPLDVIVYDSTGVQSGGLRSRRRSLARNRTWA